MKKEEILQKLKELKPKYEADGFIVLGLRVSGICKV